MKRSRGAWWVALLALVLGVAAGSPARAAVAIETTAGESLEGQLAEEFILLDSPIAGQLTLSASQVTRVSLSPGRVELAGGDVLSGTIRNEQIHIATEFASVAIRADKIKSLLVKEVAQPARSADEVEVRLTNGDRVHGALTFDKVSKPSVGVKTGYAGTISVALAEIADIQSSGEQYVVKTRDGSRLTGAITNAFFVLRAAYGELVLPRSAISGFTFPSGK
ncbi:MAG: hypothetical protein ACM3UP_00515 [Methanocella sp.]